MKTHHKLITAILAAILTLQIIDYMRVSRTISVEVQGVLISRETKIWVWSK